MQGAYAALVVFTVLYVVALFCSSSSLFPNGAPLDVEYFAWIGKCLTGLIGVTFMFHLVCEFKVNENWGGRVDSLSALSEDDQEGMSNAAKQLSSGHVGRHEPSPCRSGGRHGGQGHGECRGLSIQAAAE